MKGFIKRILLIFITMNVFLLFIGAIPFVVSMDNFYYIMDPVFAILLKIFLGFILIALYYVYEKLPSDTFLDFEKKIIYNKENKNELEEKYKLVESKYDQNYNKDTYVSSALFNYDKILYFETKDLDYVIGEIENETNLFLENSGKNSACLYIICIVENGSNENNIKAKVERRYNRLVIPFIIYEKDDKLFSCPIEYKDIIELCLFLDRRNIFTKYLRKIKLIKYIDNK